MPPLVSVVIPCHGQAHFLRDAVESVLAQTHTSHEIIVVDDGSPDDVPGALAPYPGVLYHRQANRGVGAARNAGLERATGEYVVFLDADDRLLATALAIGAQTLAAHPLCAFVWGFNRPIDARGKLLPFKPHSFSGGASYRQLLRENVVGPPVGVMFRRASVVAVGGFSIEIKGSEDFELYLRLARQYESWCHGELIAEYRYHSANMSANDAAILTAMLRALDEQSDWVRDDSELREAVREGRRRAWRDYDGEPRVKQLSEHIHAKRWLAAVGCTATLLVKYPGLFFQVLSRRVKRGRSA